MKKISLLLFGLWMMFSLAACGGGQTESTPAPEENESEEIQETMNIGAMPSIDKVPIIVGIEQGFFEKYGLDVNVENFQSPIDRNTALQAGEMDGVMSDMVADVLYLANGMDMKMTSLIQTDFAVIASKDSGLTSVEEITETHKNGIALNCLMEYIADKAGKAEKVMVPDVMTRIEQVLSGDLDLAVVPEPYGTMAEARGAVKIGSSSDLGIFAAVMLFPAEYIENHHAAVEAFYAGYEDSVAYLAEHGIDEVLDAVIEKGEFSADASEALKAVDFVSLQAPDAAQYADVIAWMNQHPEFKGPYDSYADFDAVSDFSFLK